MTELMMDFTQDPRYQKLAARLSRLSPGQRQTYNRLVEDLSAQGAASSMKRRIAEMRDWGGTGEGPTGWEKLDLQKKTAEGKMDIAEKKLNLEAADSASRSDLRARELDLSSAKIQMARDQLGRRSIMPHILGGANVLLGGASGLVKMRQDEAMTEEIRKLRRENQAAINTINRGRL